MEVVDGETHAQRLERGPMPVEEALHAVSQIAEALAAAHEKGLIHRDLKPANIKLTRDGKVKVLDFGLVKILADTDSPDVLGESPTVVSRTESGMILGTPAYMSPEQARAMTVDRRTDVWAFGCVLYEMLTGKRAFESLRDQPDWELLPKTLSPGW